MIVYAYPFIVVIINISLVVVFGVNKPLHCCPAVLHEVGVLVSHYPDAVSEELLVAVRQCDSAAAHSTILTILTSTSHRYAAHPSYPPWCEAYPPYPPVHHTCMQHTRHTHQHISQVCSTPAIPISTSHRYSAHPPYPPVHLTGMQHTASTMLASTSHIYAAHCLHRTCQTSHIYAAH